MTVEIYSTPPCKYCDKAKSFFKENSVDYTEYNVAADEEKKTQMIDMTGQRRVPVMVIDGLVLVGFTENEQKLKELFQK